MKEGWTKTIKSLDEYLLQEWPRFPELHTAAKHHRTLQYRVVTRLQRHDDDGHAL